MKSQKSTAHAVKDSYPIYKYRTDVVDAVFLYGSAASKERNLSAWAASLTLALLCGLEPRSNEWWHTTGNCIKFKTKTDTIFFARLVPNSDHDVDVNSMLVFGIYGSRMKTITL